MKVPRVRIADLMVIVALVAFDFATLPGSVPYKLLVLGSVPMANILVIAGLVGLRRRKSRRFLIGFGAFGVAALTVYIVLATRYHYEVMVPCVEFVSERFEDFWFSDLLFIHLTLAVVLTVPQLALALVGGIIAKAARRGGRTPSPDA